MRRLILPFLILLLPLLAHAEIVKWVDDKGEVHYSDQPPATAKTPKTLNIKNQPGASAPAQKSLADQELEFRKRQMEAEDAAKKAAEDKKQAEIAQQNCASARANLKMLQDGVRMTKYNEKGERVFLDDADRAKAIAEAQRAVSDWCK
jgi:hypothetical protein